MVPFVVLALVVELGTGFAGGSAVAESAPGGDIAVRLEVNVTGGEGPVVAHVLLPGEPEEIHPMLDRGGGNWSTVVTARRADWTVVFEDVGRSLLSDPVNLTALGVELGAGVTRTEPSPESAPGPPPWRWLAVAVGAMVAAVLLGLFAPRRYTPRHLRTPRGG